MSLDNLLPLIRKTGSPLSPPEFHKAVNVVFHDIEAGHYDTLHADMWESLAPQMQLLVADASDCIRTGELRVLDIGCGTGLSSQLLLESSIGAQIHHITLADTSPNMLAVAKKRAEQWNRPFKTHIGDISSVTGKYDLILVCSVLHHIPDIEEFLARVSNLQDEGGILLHLQDPNGDYLNDGLYRERLREFESTRQSGIVKRVLDLVPKGIKASAKRMIGMKSYIDEVNDKLLAMKAISLRMTEDEIWSVTDIHVDGLPFSTGEGISLTRMQAQLKGYKLVAARSYGFFGYLKSTLPKSFQLREQRYIDEMSPNGRYISGIWAKV